MRYFLIAGWLLGGAVVAAVPTGALRELASAGARPSARHAAREAAARARQFPYTSYDGRFIFARVFYDFGMRGWDGGRIGSSGGPPWSHDYPTAEQNFTQIVRELTYIRPYTEGGNILSLDDPRLFQFPVAYMSEPGYWRPTEEEVKGLRNYLLKGGFIVFDDFGGRGDGDRQMYNLVEQMGRVFPELAFLPLDATDPIFDSFFQIDPLSISLIYEDRRPVWWGLFLDNDKGKRMLAVAGQHGDLGEFWEYSATGWAPVDMSNEAYKVGVNYIIYAMTH